MAATSGSGPAVDEFEKDPACVVCTRGLTGPEHHTPDRLKFYAVLASGRVPPGIMD